MHFECISTIFNTIYTIKERVSVYFCAPIILQLIKKKEQKYGNSLCLNISALMKRMLWQNMNAIQGIQNTIKLLKINIIMSTSTQFSLEQYKAYGRSIVGCIFGSYFIYAFFMVMDSFIKFKDNIDLYNKAKCISIAR